jgi:apolipoprotein N-acyltransferase
MVRSFRWFQPTYCGLILAWLALWILIALRDTHLIVPDAAGRLLAIALTIDGILIFLLMPTWPRGEADHCTWYIAVLRLVTELARGVALLLFTYSLDGYVFHDLPQTSLAATLGIVLIYFAIIDPPTLVLKFHRRHVRANRPRIFRSRYPQF